MNLETVKARVTYIYEKLHSLTVKKVTFKVSDGIVEKVSSAYRFYTEEEISEIKKELENLRFSNWKEEDNNMRKSYPYENWKQLIEAQKKVEKYGSVLSRSYAVWRVVISSDEKKTVLQNIGVDPKNMKLDFSAKWEIDTDQPNWEE